MTSTNKKQVINLDFSDTALWKAWFCAPKILWLQLAKVNPKRGLIAYNGTGIYQLYALELPSGNLAQITERPEGALFGSLSPDGQYLYYLNDMQGNDLGHIVAQSLDTGAIYDLTPNMSIYSWSGIGYSRYGKEIALALAQTNQYNLFLLKSPQQDNATLELIYQTDSLMFNPILSSHGEIAIVHQMQDSQLKLLAINTDTKFIFAELGDGNNSAVIATDFSPLPQDYRVLAISDLNGAKRPLIWNPYTNERLDFPLNELQGDVEAWDWSHNGKHLLLCQIYRAVRQLYVFHLDDQSLHEIEYSETVLSAYFGESDEIVLHSESSTQSGQIVVITGKVAPHASTVLRGKPIVGTRAWHSIQFNSTDEEAIQGWLALPESRTPLATIIELHGGPQDVQMETFSPSSQTWLHHGFAYLTINYRGSTTFGKDFERKIWGDIGHWELEDLVTARQWLIEEKISDPAQIFLMGWSYGGYLVLQALGRQPDLWAGGIASCGIADWSIQFEDTIDSLKGYQLMLFGGSPEQIPEKYTASSPITYTDNVKAPLLIFHPRNDRRTVPRSIEHYQNKMQILGKYLEICWFDGGHLGPLSTIERSISQQEIALDFLYRVLGRV
jgi:dipeptidyl aminopeptidase/acylaminoacyl peptidase